ncbi:DUF924 family protein [Trinickia fusca]|uniref:DUF924 domain-containing protein n=1 Tax=Trinickia fusca TaxID=2419777 RepID=A0A494WYV8_9BURK|nr:DUF924 family protein [Trinickia fusca]RKP43715.1 DUF924 domain-containing protein [Trinickia fusca]
MTHPHDIEEGGFRATEQAGGDPRAFEANGAGHPSADYLALPSAAREVLDFWFGAPDSPRFGRADSRWFARDDAFDAELTARFAPTLASACSGELDDWQRTPLGALALILVLDQFSRNLHRGHAQAFAGDARALAAAQQLVRTQADRLLPTSHHRVFAYLPFEHAESLEAQRESVRLFDALAEETGERGNLEYAIRHWEIVERFGRFPHRNVVLGRTSTDEERAFLLEPNSSF